MKEIRLDDKSKRTNGAVMLSSVPLALNVLLPTEVMALDARLRFLSCGYWVRLSGIRARLLKLKSIVSIGVVGGMFLKMDSISLSVILRLLHEMVNVKLLPSVGPQTHGAMSAAYSGH